MAETVKVQVEVPNDYWLIKETLDFFLDLATYQRYSSGRYAQTAAAVFNQIQNQIEGGDNEQTEGPRES